MVRAKSNATEVAFGTKTTRDREKCMAGRTVFAWPVPRLHRVDRGRPDRHHQRERILESSRGRNLGRTLHASWCYHAAHCLLDP